MVSSPYFKECLTNISFMKNLLLVISLVCFTVTSFAKEYSFNAAEKIFSGSKLIITNDANGTIKYIQLKEGYNIPVKNNEAWLNTLLNISNVEAFKLYKKETDKYGFTHYKFKQFIHGFPVEDGVFYIHAKNGYIISANGEYYPITNLSSTSVSISPARAIEIGKKSITNSKESFNDKVTTRPIKVIVSDKNGAYSLAYKTDIYSQHPLVRKYIYVDASTGKIIKEKNRIHNADVVGVGVTKYSGTRAITADSIGVGSYILKDNGRNVYTRDLNEAYFSASAVDFTDTDNIWNNINAQQDEVASDAHWAAESFYDYFLTTFGINSYDNAGSPLNTYVHYGVNYDNVFWDGTSVSCGDGNGTTNNPHTALDVISHEFSHGIIENTSNLLGSYESGSLSESYCDIFGTAIEFYAKPGSANYTFAENVSITGTPIRSLSNPNTYGHPDTYLGTNWATGPADNGGIHTNNGVQNFWFYLLTNGGSGTNDIGDSYSVTGIGMANAVSIAYRTLTVYLTSNSQYTDARTFSIQAAVDLYGACSAEAVATQDAWYAVGIGTSSSNSPVVAGFSSDVQFSCSVPTTVNFIDLSQNATISYKWYFGDGDSSSVANPSHPYSAAGVYTVTLIVEGIGSCGTQADTLIQTNYITITNGGGPVTASCSPITTGAGTVGMGIFNFTLNTINNSTALGGLDSYQDYSCSQSTTLTEGNFYNINITTGITYNENVIVWIDFDNDGTFAPIAEKVFESSNILQNHSGSIIIPAGAILSTPLRVRVSSDYYANTVGPCTNSQYGQHEDYTVTIIPNTNPPVVDFAADNVVVNISQTVNFTDLSQNVPTSWNWTFSGATPSSSVQQNPSVSYAAIGTYPVTLVASNAFGADSLTKTAYISVVNQFNMCVGIDSTNATSGLLFDSGGSIGNYSNNENCSFLINPGCAIDVTLTFSSINMESCCDRIRVYDGIDATGTLLLTATGSTIPGPVTASSGSMFITFTSDGSVVYSGFDASWNSTVPTSPPVANFSISNSNPPLNTVVNFTDLSTNYPGAWSWDFGDGNFSSSQNPSHAYMVPGTYSVQLIADNCFALDTISYNLTVQDSAFISVSPNPLLATSLCGDSITEQITIYNSGNGDLVTSISGASSNNVNSDFYDGFESGTLANWTMEAGAYTKQITSSNPGAGTYSLEFINGAGAHLDGISAAFSNATPNEISFKVKNSSTTEIGSMIVIGDNPATLNDGLFYMYMSNNATFYVNGIANVASYSANQWVTLELKNIDWTSKVFDLYVDGSLIISSLTFQNTGISQINKVHLYAWSSTSTCSFDEIQIGENVAPSWIFITTTDTLVPANDSTIIDVTFNATGLLAGVYNDTLTFYSNDTTNSPLYVLVVFTVTGQPLISFSPSSFNFGSLQVGASTTDTLYIDNIGCDTLDITSFVSTNVSFTVNSGAFLIPPYSSDTVIITFSPNAIQVYADTIFIINNDTTAFVLVNGVGVGAPIISYNPTSITDTIFGCNDSLVIPVTVYNTGQGPLYTSISVNGSSSGSGSDFYDGFESGTLANWTMEAGAYTKQITSSNPGAGTYSLEFINGAGAHLDGISAAFSNATPNEISFKVKNSSTTEIGSMIVIGDNPATLNDGLFYMYMSNNATFYVNGIANVASYSANQWVTLELKNIDWTSKVFDLYVDGSLIISSLTFQNTGISQINKVHLYAWSSTSTCSFDEITIGGVPSPSWITTSTDTLNTAIGDSSIFFVTLYSAGLNAGTYSSNIVLTSNDPLSPFDTIPVSFTVIGAPEIGFSASCLNFGSIMENTTATDSVTIYNNGCDTLYVTNISSTLAEYSPNVTTLIILPGDSGNVVVTFAPTSIGSFNSTLNIFNSDVDTTICLTGSATGAPIISVNPTSINVNLFACQDSVTIPVTVYNTGQGPLYSSISVSSSSSGSGGAFYDGFESGNLSTWLSGGGSYTNIVTTSAPANGTYSLSMTGGASTHYNGIYHSFGPAAVSTLSYKVKTQGGGITGLVVIGDNNITSDNGMAMTYFSGNTFYFYTPSTGSITTTINPNQWYQVEFKNIDYSAKTFDYYFDGALLSTSVQFRSITINSLSRIHLYGWDSGLTSFYDEITIGGIPAPNWIITSTDTLNTAISDSSIFFVTLYSAGLNGGTHYADITINSNDPVTPQIMITCTLNVSFDPCADFTYNIPNICSGQVDFTDITTNNPTTWSWTFGDGSSSSAQNPSYTYAGAGSYTVELIACNGTSCDTVSYVVTISNTNGPIAAFCSPITTTAGTVGMGVYNVSFNSINNTTNGGTDSYQDYTCGVSTTVTEGNSYAINVTTGSGYGEDVRVWIDFDNDGQFNMTNELVFVSDNILQNHSGSVAIPTGLLIGTPLRMRVISDYESNSITTSCYTPAYGQCEDYTVLIQSNNQPPIANFSYNILNQCQGVIQFTDISTNFPTSWFWNFDDGTTSTNQNPFHTYTSAGLYNVTLTATNSFGSDVYNQQIIINSLNASIDILSTTLINQPINFNANAPGAISWSWDFGDGYLANIQSPTHTYINVGQYVVTLIVTNGAGCTSTAYDTINIFPVSIDEHDSYFMIFPNPNNGTLYIVNKTSENISSINIISALGKLVFSFNNNENYFNSQKIELNEVSTGVYFVKILYEDNNLISRKFLIK